MKSLGTYIADKIDWLNDVLGRAVSWLTLAMVLLMFTNVVMRYILQTGEPWQQELVRFFFAIIFLAGAGYTLKANEQVRVDVLYSRFSLLSKAWVDLIGTILLLWPVCATIILCSFDYVLNSWSIHEGSSELRGMSGVFLIKTCIWIFAATLFLQGVSTVIRSWQVIRAEATSS